MRIIPNPIKNLISDTFEDIDSGSYISVKFNDKCKFIIFKEFAYGGGFNLELDDAFLQYMFLEDMWNNIYYICYRIR